MAEYMHLIGAEDVRTAANRMASAGADMQQAATIIDSALERHRGFMDDWLQRLEAVMRPQA